ADGERADGQGGQGGGGGGAAALRAENQVSRSTTERVRHFICPSLSAASPPQGTLAPGGPPFATALYLPTLTAVCLHPLLQAVCGRLGAAGEPKMRAIGACMRKIVMLCYGVLKTRMPFDPAWSKKTR